MKKKLIVSVALLFVFNLVLFTGVEAKALAGPGLKLVGFSKAQGKTDSETTMYIGADEMVLESEQNGGFTMTFDAKKEEIRIINHKQKQFNVLGKTELAELSKQLESMVGLLKAFYKNLPPETQERFAPLVNGKPTNLIFQQNGSGTVEKWRTTNYKVTEGGQKALFDMDIASFSTVGVKANDVTAVKKLSQLLNKYLAGIETLVPGASIFSNLSDDKNPMFTKGIPVKTVSYNSKGGVTDEFVVTEAAKTSFSLSDFKVPAGYRQTKINLDNPLKK